LRIDLRLIVMPLHIFDFDAPRRLPQQPNPNAVRAYIRHILITKHDATPQFAEEIAEQWHLGRLRDLYDASAGSLIKRFGPDVGPHIFRSVREDIWVDWWNSYQGLQASGMAVWVLSQSPTRELILQRMLGHLRFIGSLDVDPCM
jgi:hypothetical protein